MTAVPQKKKVTWSNMGVGAVMQVFEVATLGQPFEVLKTHLAANRGDSLAQAFSKSWNRGGIFGFYQGLFPWAMIEASTKGAVLMFAQAEMEWWARRAGASSAWASAIGGMGGGVVQAYSTMGFCTFMKTVEVTRHKGGADGHKTTFQVAREVIARDGLLAMNRGVTAVAVRQMTNWGSRFGISKAVESMFKGKDSKRELSAVERLSASVVGGTLSCWNQPIEVIRVEMQSASKGTEARKLNIMSAAKVIYQDKGFLGFYRGITPRVCLGVWQTVCMVFAADTIKELLGARGAAGH
ncbi:mitochondrial solute carrier [Andalucia godoyi]|uniref:Mitochondrial solute carrier n=1 Tax=Andalucia godoyi TaxID=505711 RepID=A0A8K0F4C7_ANDGO|nr:mitochondrial solute carrier [Andalucia godoyi]|eukprot:ANDGO_02718.mRNA.1 mitochondrial solute carrier